MKRILALAAVMSALGLALGVSTASACPPPPSADGSSALRAFAAAPSDDPFYYTRGLNPRPTTTHSKIPLLPVYNGFMHTNDTFRFINVAEQVFTMIGEGKHGLWRVQENGMIREYLRAGAAGLRAGADLADPENLAVLERDYSHYLPGEGFAGYKDPFVPVNDQGALNFVDLPITHPKYKGAYDGHVPIDLAHWYCTMSDADFPEAKLAAAFSFAQPGANQVGPLGRRAGLDVRELYTNVLRLTPFADARVWVNVGDEDDVRWKALDTRRTRAEFYLYERPFFNVPYLFLTAVLENGDNADFRYTRPNGPYYDSVKGIGKLKTTVTRRPQFHLDGGETRRVTGTRLYGVHHPNRPADVGESGGGACPMKGGDWDGYPDTKGGSGWPTQYEEVTPVCDGVVVDIKFTANLDGASWDSETKYLANAGVGQREVIYTVQEGVYGRFTDPWLVDRGVENPEATRIGPEERLRFPAVREPVGYTPVP